MTPLPLAEVVAVAGTPPAEPGASEVGEATPFVVANGEPADTDTSEAIVATLRQLFACTNGGDFLAGTPLTEEVDAFLDATPQPPPNDQRRVIVRVGEVRILRDGRAGVPLVLDGPSDPRAEEPDDAILAFVDGRWLVDEIHADAAPAATPSVGAA